MLELGKRAIDKITGFGGIITGRAQYITGCDQYCIQPACPTNDFKDAKWFDESRIEITGEGIVPKQVTGDAPGGPAQNAPVK